MNNENNIYLKQRKEYRKTMKKDQYEQTLKTASPIDKKMTVKQKYGRACIYMKLKNTPSHSFTSFSQQPHEIRQTPMITQPEPPTKTSHREIYPF
jgi:hypothetical protein